VAEGSLGCACEGHDPCRQRGQGGAERAHRDDGGAPPVRPAMRWIWVASSASARRIAGRMVAKCRASIDVLAPSGTQEKDALLCVTLAL
jgi:hypothetical protein